MQHLKDFIDPRVPKGITTAGYYVVFAVFVLLSLGSAVSFGGSLGGMVGGQHHVTTVPAPKWLPNDGPLPPVSAQVKAAPTAHPNTTAWYVHNVYVHYLNGYTFDISSYVNSEGDKYGVSPIFIAAVMGTESGMTVDVQRWAGGIDNSCGLMQQILVNVAAHIGDYNASDDCSWELNPYNSIDFGTQILAQYIAYHGGRVQPPWAYIMYNAGAGYADSYYFNPPYGSVAYVNYYDNFLPNWNYAWSHYALYSNPTPTPRPTPTPKPFPTSRWCRYDRSHGLPCAPHTWHGHVARVAAYWWHTANMDTKCGGVKTHEVWYAGLRVMRQDFSHCTVWSWPRFTGDPVKVRHYPGEIPSGARR